MSSKAPYRHPDGTNCYTKDCSLGHTKPAESYSDLLKKLIEAEKKKLPIKLNLETPQQVKMRRFGMLKTVFTTTLPEEFDKTKFTPVVNSDTLSIEKPNGGLWLAVKDEAGNDGWNAFNGSNGMHRYKVELDPFSKVAVIETPEDYVGLLQKYGTTELPEGDFFVGYAGGAKTDRMGNPRIHLDYEKLAKDYDGLYVSREGLNSCGMFDPEDSKNALPSNVSTLNFWDIPSFIVFNKDAIQSTVSDPIPAGLNDYEIDEYDEYEILGLER